VRPVSGWYPDPMGRFEYRYHNGQAWTADVSTGGRRYVDPLSAAGPPGAPFAPPGTGAASPARRAGNGIALAGMVCGIVSLVIGWLPFVGLIGLVAAVVGLGLSIPGLLRGRETGERKGFAIAGVVTSSAGILLGGLGIVFTVLLWRAVERFESPGAHSQQVECTVDDTGFVVARGGITNDSGRSRDYSVLVRLTADERHRVVVDDVAPGATGSFTVRSDEARHSDVDAAACGIVEVNGPVPFGLEPDLFD
jgi:Protein of unknown function (DUF2510)